MTCPSPARSAASQARLSLALGALEHALQRTGGIPLVMAGEGPTETGHGSVIEALRALALSDALRLGGVWWRAKDLETRAALVDDAERACAVHIALVTCESRRNATPAATTTPAPMSRADQERAFQAIMTAYDQCILRVHKEAMGGPLNMITNPFAPVDGHFAHEQSEALRADRDRLKQRWAAATTDADRLALIKFAQMWFAAGSAGVAGCQGVVDKFGDAMSAQAMEYVDDAKKAIKKGARGLFNFNLDGLAKPLIWVGAGVGGILLLALLMPAMRRRE